ncbi:hypothetical protein PAMC26510_18950 [Caballeronia sordidicola]|uniref:Uncharacterized protein n=1 Tax=Caballeronia sordidicola TaxID=196367 RepID=A0A242MQ30_CABSO|nr:hypothetical protein PAMC26510_18950 [Caballeronia sordidicola]
MANGGKSSAWRSRVRGGSLAGIEIRQGTPLSLNLRQF